jgi:hypothetical protein
MRYSLHRVVPALIMLGLILGSLSSALPAAAAPVAAPATAPAVRYFRETGHNIAGDIKAFYEAKGDLRIFGLPLTEVIVENGRQVQYFERARFELHPELPKAYYVSLTHVGKAFSGGRTAGAFAATGPNGAGAYFKETGHNLNSGFLAFWNKYGGLPVFGYPLSEEFDEASPTDGIVRTVQYFERARFEYHADAPVSYQVQLGLLGRQYLDISSVPAAARKPVPEIGVLGTATTSYFGSFEERVNNIARSAANLNGMVVQPGQTFSFNASIGDTGADSGYVDGYAIVGGRLEKVVGGGICQVSTTLYRAVFNAGLDIVSRRNHSYVINFYENVAGWDATVYAPYTDFKWRNDTAGPIWIYTTTNPAKATVTFTIYGYPDGRTTNVVQPGKANWQYDPNLKRGQTTQLVHGRPGMDVAMRRVVTAANGTVLHNDNLPSKYKAWEDFFLYGPGVTPPKGVNVIPATTRAANPKP